MTATLGNSVYLGTKSSATASKPATAEAIQLPQDQGDTEALASDEYKNAATDEAKNAIKQKYEAKYIHAANIAAMDKDGISAGVTNYDTDYTYGNDSSYNYAGSQADGIVTVGGKDATRRIQNVSAGLVGPTSTDAVNGSQLYALTRQIRFGGDNSSFGTTAADDQNVVARGSNEAISITGGSDAVTSSNVDGKTTNTVDTAKLTGNNIAVVADADKNALHVQLASNLKDLNTAQLGSGSGESYKETIKLDGTGTNGGQMTLAGADGTVKTTLDTTGLTIANGPKFTSSGIDAASQKIHNVTAGTDDADAVNVKQLQSARTLLTQGTNITLADTDADGHHTYTGNVDNLAVKANKEAAKSVTLKNGLTFNDGTNTTASVEESGAVSYNLNQEISLKKVTTGNSTLDTEGLTISGGPKIAASGIDAGNRVISGVANGSNDTDAVNVSQLKAIQSDVNAGWTIKGKDPANADVNANIGKGKTVTYDNGNYIKSVVTKDDSTSNATVKVDVTTGTFGSGTGDKAGTVTSTANGLATTQDVANAINSASISVVADDTPDNKTSVKAGDTIHFAKDDNLTLTQDGTQFTYGLNKEISISQVTTSDATNGSTVQDAKGITTTDAAGNTYIQDGKGITLTPSDKTKSPVKLTNTGLNNGSNKITGVGKGTDDADAVNMAQLKEVNDKVGSGWQIAGNDGQKVADIGAGKKVSFKTDSQYLTADTKTAGTDAANVTYGLKTKTLTAADGKVSAVDTAEDGLATAKNVADTINQTYWTAASGKSGSGSQTDETANDADKKISAGDTVTFNAGNNLFLAQNGASFTYGLQADLIGMNTITFTPRNDAEGHPISLVIGKQKDGVGTDEGYYITGLDNTTWNQSNYVKDRAATEAQLADAIKQVTLASKSGGFKLSDDNNKEVSQVLGQAIGVVGDSNITTTAETTTTDTNGHIRIRLNNTLDLTDQGSVTIGSSQVSDGSIVLNNTDTTKKIALNSTAGTASIGGVTVNGAAKTVSGLSNTEWNVEKAAADGYKESNQAATESQLQTVYNQATKTASENELHTLAKEGGYTVDDNHQVSMDVVNGKGETKDSIVIKDLAKASEVGTVSDIAKDLQNKNGDTTKPTSVVEAINNLNDKVGDKNYLNVKGEEIANGDSATTAIGKLNNRMNDIYQTAGQHTTVSNSDKNLVIKPTTDNKGKTNYEINLSKQVTLGDVKFDGEKGSIEAKSVKADSFTSGSTVVNNDGVQVGKGTALTSDSLKVGGNTYVDNKGLNANGNAIRNVGDGKDNGDAVNMKQLNEVKSDYKAADTELAKAIQQTDAGLNEVGRAVNKLGNRLNRVGAGAAALAALHPGTYDPNDKWDFSAGIGHYHDANAVAIGAYYHPNDTTILSIGGSMGGGENMVNAGITWKMGRSGHEQRAAQPVVTHPVQAAPVVQQAAPARPAPVATPAPVVTPAPVTTPVPVKAVVPATPAPAVTTTAMTAAPSGDTAALTQILARQTAILEKLAQNQSQAARPTAVAHGDDIFPDVPENHWAYAYVAKLEKAGALKGFKRPAVLKSPMMTRDDFATVLYTAMANGATTNPALNGDDSLNRLAQEFKAELKDVKP